MSIEVVQDSGSAAPVGPYSQGIKAGGFVFVAGEKGIDPDTGEIVAGGIQAETKQTFSNIEGISLEFPVDANELFVRIPIPLIEGLLAEGFLFYRWETEGTLARIVTAFDTDPAHVEAFLTAARRIAG